VDLVFRSLDAEHDRAAFSCGEESVDRFLKDIARQRSESNAAITMAATPADNRHLIVGYYTLIPHEFRGEELPDIFRKKTGVGKLTAVPGVLLAQLGVDRNFQGQGIGIALMQHALRRCAVLARDFGAVAIVTDPINERAMNLYRSFDFVPLLDGEPRLILPMKTAIRAIEREERAAYLADSAEAILGDIARQWLTKPHSKLGGRTPAACCGSDGDLERALQLLYSC
jgi:GNAT superfamily N-acetyltransferase